jgi:hypothetical protein
VAKQGQVSVVPLAFEAARKGCLWHLRLPERGHGRKERGVQLAGRGSNSVVCGPPGFSIIGQACIIGAHAYIAQQLRGDFNVFADNEAEAEGWVDALQLCAHVASIKQLPSLRKALMVPQPAMS